jgi:hypothetical protein
MWVYVSMYGQICIYESGVTRALRFEQLVLAPPQDGGVRIQQSADGMRPPSDRCQRGDRSVGRCSADAGATAFRHQALQELN